MRYGLTTREFAPWFQVFDELMEPERPSFNPAVDVDETDSHYLMSFDLPGISKDDVKIELLENQLTVSGEKTGAVRKDKHNRHLTERNYGSFQRVFTLPSNIEGTKVEASYKDGVLQIALPKAETAKARQVKISEGKTGFFSKFTVHNYDSDKKEVGATANP